jgi:hypothetical protein
MKKSATRYTQEATSSTHAAAAHHRDRSGGVVPTGEKAACGRAVWSTRAVADGSGAVPRGAGVM